jgi:hypothetical protein
MTGVKWIQNRYNAVGDRGVMSIKSTMDEQNLLHALLRQNAALIPSDFRVDCAATEKEFKCSVLLPLGPLGQENFGKLTATAGCQACGNTLKLSRCSSCQLVEYCSKGDAHLITPPIWMAYLRSSRRMPTR